ncbi:MAG: ubiquitin-conjugating enzyme E2 variant [Candidatus Kariarchaeaceae archaeon]|jgi:hypothetical protein
MIDDAILAREAYLIYQNAFGFEPDGGDMTRWKGIVRDSVGREVVIVCQLPPNFPLSPPDFQLPQDCKHPIAANGKIVTRSISRWKKDFHAFQVIREVRQAIASAPFSLATTVVSTSEGGEMLKRQVSYLKSELANKKQEFEQLQTSSVSHQSGQAGTQQAVKEVREDALVSLQNEIYALEDSYDQLEIDGLEFSRKFLILQKRYHMIVET